MRGADVSVRERRNRKGSRAKTPEELWRWRCRLCAQKITHSQRYVIRDGECFHVGSCPPNAGYDYGGPYPWGR